MKSKILIILILSLLLNVSYANNRRAMLVGVQNYRAFASLEACHGDVDAMKELLKQAGFEDDHIWAIKDAGFGELITASDLFSNVNAFARGIQAGDEVVFFFSGHGIGGSDGKNYLLGADGNIDNPERYGSISVEEIKQIIKEKNPSEVVLIVDACRNFIKKEGKGTGEKVASNMNIGKGIKVLPTIETSGATGKSRKKDQTIIKTIFAASEGQQSFERKDKGKGAFTYYMTYLLESPNSAMDIDMSKDGVITIEDLVQFADNRLADWTRSQDLPTMNPVYQTEGGITYEPFMLFSYNPEKVVEEQKKEGNKPIFEYNAEAELAKIKKFTENKEYLKEDLPVYQPKPVSEKKIEVDNTDLSSWELALAQEEEIKKAKDEQARKEAEAKDKERIYNQLRDKYNNAVSDLDKTKDIFMKFQQLENLRNEINEVKYAEVKHKLLPLLEPIYQKIKESKDVTQAEVEDLKPQFEKDISDMEKMIESSLSEELKKKYLDEFRKKWQDYAKIQKDEELSLKYRYVDRKKKIISQTTNMELNFVIGGSFDMGGEGNDNERPIHNVVVDDFYIGIHEVTIYQFYRVFGIAKRHENIDMPIDKISWEEAAEFCNKLSEMEGLEICYSGLNSGNMSNKKCDFNANGYRLPTEAEWEYAAKGGIHWKDNYKYSGSNSIDEVGWYKRNSGNTLKSVGIKKPNQLGLYDMNGNVWEWCWDFYSNDYYKKSPINNPKGPDETKHFKSEDYERVLRGGSIWYDHLISITRRNSYAPYASWAGFGFRVVRNAK